MEIKVSKARLEEDRKKYSTVTVWYGSPALWSTMPYILVSRVKTRAYNEYLKGDHALALVETVKGGDSTIAETGL